MESDFEPGASEPARKNRVPTVVAAAVIMRLSRAVGRGLGHLHEPAVSDGGTPDI